MGFFKDLTAGAVSGLAGNIFGQMSNKSAVESTNRTNLEIARQNNAFNERMMEKQMAYNTKMYQDQNFYNSASQQRKRLEEAGLNPYMMMYGGNAGTAGNALGVTAPTAAPANMVAPQYDTASFGDAIRTLIDSTKVKKENDNLKMLTETGYRIASTQEALNKALEKFHGVNTGYIRELKDTQERLNSIQDMNYNEMMWSYRIDLSQKYMQLQATRLQCTGMILQQAFQVARLPYAETFASQEAALTASQIALNYANGNLSRAKAKEAMANILLIGKQGEKTDAETGKISRENKMFDKVFDVTVGAVKAHKEYLTKLYQGYGALPQWMFTTERLGLSPGDVKQDLKDAAGSAIQMVK